MILSSSISTALGMYCGHHSITNTYGINGKIHWVKPDRICDYYSSVYQDGQWYKKIKNNE
jgi:hypothetical protein